MTTLSLANTVQLVSCCDNRSAEKTALYLEGIEDSHLFEDTVGEPGIKVSSLSQHAHLAERVVAA